PPRRRRPWSRRCPSPTASCAGRRRGRWARSGRPARRWCRSWLACWPTPTATCASPRRAPRARTAPAPPRPRPPLLRPPRRARTREPESRLAVVRTLESIGSEAPASVAVLSAALADADDRVRRVAAQALERVVPSRRDADALLRPSAKEPPRAVGSLQPLGRD